MQKNKWNQYKLKDLVNINASSVSKHDNLSCILYLDTGSVTAGKIKELLEVSYNNAPSRAKRKVKNSSIVYSMVRPNQLHYGLIKNPSKNMIVSTGFAVIDCYEERANSKFIYYWLTQSCITNFLQAIAENSTSAYPAIRPEDLENLDISLPPLDEQKRIAEVLGAFDDKIELLQKQNKTLEDMAKALFKSWFVDFDVVRAKQKGLPKADIMREYHLTEELYDLFPSSFADSSLGPIPSGWETSNLDSLCIRCQSGGTPSTKHAEYWENAVIDWFSTKELQDSFLLNSEKTISEEGLNNSSAKLFPKGTIIMAIYDSPTVGRLGILTQEATFNQAAVGFIPKEDKISREYLFLMLKHRRDDLNNLANGAAQQNLSVGVVKAFNILIPNAALNTVYKRIVSPLFNKMEFNVKQIQTLTELRDTLLPRLISGKIRV